MIDAEYGYDFATLCPKGRMGPKVPTLSAMIRAGLASASKIYLKDLLSTFAMLGLAIAAMTALCLSVVVLPLADYPNHLARLYIQSHIGNDPLLNSYYRLFWHFQPNLSLEMVSYVLSPLFDIYTLGRLLGAMTFASLAIGLVLLHRVIHGRFSPAAFLPLVMIVNRHFLWGSIGYLLALGVAFASVAAWLELRQRPVLQFVVGTMLATLVYFGHLYAFIAYAICTGGYEVYRQYPRLICGPAMLRGVAVTGQLMPAVLSLLLLSPTIESDQNIRWRPVLDKLTGAIVLTPGYNLTLEFALLAACFAVPFIAWLRGIAVLRLDFVVAIAAFLFLYLILPDQLFSGYGADRRIVLPCAMLALLSFDWRLATPTARLRQWALVAAVLGTQLLHLTNEWHAYDRIYADVLRLTRLVEPGASIAQTTANATPEFLTFPPLHEVVCLFVIERSALVPSLFTFPANATSSPLSYRPPYTAVLPPSRIINLADQRAAQARFDAGEREVEKAGIQYLLLVDDTKFRLEVPSSYRLVGEVSDARVRLFRIGN